MSKNEQVRRIDLRPSSRTVGAGATFTTIPPTPATPVDPTDTSQFLKTDGSRQLTGNLTVASGVKVDCMDISDHPRAGWGHVAMEVPSNRRFKTAGCPTGTFPEDWSYLTEDGVTVTWEDASDLGIGLKALGVTIALASEARTGTLKWKRQGFVPRLARLNADRVYLFDVSLKTVDLPVDSVTVNFYLFSHDTQSTFTLVQSAEFTDIPEVWTTFSTELTVTEDDMAAYGEFIYMEFVVSGLSGIVHLSMPHLYWKPGLFRQFIEWVGDSAKLLSSLYVGRRDGAHVGLFDTWEGTTERFYLEAADIENVPFVSMGGEDGVRNGEFLRFGYRGFPGIELVEVDGYERKQLRVDVDTFSRAIVSGDIDMGDLAENFALYTTESLYGVELPEGVLVIVDPPGTLYLSRGSGVYDLLLGGGLIMAHSHMDELSGGQLDHGSAITATSLADDDHEQYLKEKLSGGLSAEVPEHDHSSLDGAGPIAMIGNSDPQYLHDEYGNLLTSESGEYLTTGIRDGAEILELSQLEDVDVSLGAGVDGHFLVWDNASSKFTLLDHGAESDPHSVYLLASGARVGAVSQAQEFTVGIKLPQTSGADIGVISKNTDPFIHDYADPTSSGDNLFIGVGAGNFTMSPAGGGGHLSTENTGIGASTLEKVTTGYKLLALGAHAGRNITTGYRIVAIGSGALAANQTGSYILALGTQALSGFLGSNATALGAHSQEYLIYGEGNITVGYYSLAQSRYPNKNIVVGDVGMFKSEGWNNIGVGWHVGYESNVGDDNIILGSSGFPALGVISDDKYKISNIDYNTPPGSAYQVVTTRAAHGLSGGETVVIRGVYGYPDEYVVTVLSPTTFQITAPATYFSGGTDAFWQLLDATRYNIGVGSSVGGTLTFGQKNIFIGDHSGVGIVLGSNNIILGSSAGTPGSADLSNTVVLGNDDITDTYLKAIVHAGTQVITPIVYGGTAANDDITIEGTSHATKGTSYVILQPTGGGVVIGGTDPGTSTLAVIGSSNTTVKVVGGAASNPSIDWYQDSTQKAYIQYIDSGDYLRIVDNGVVGIVQKSGAVGIGVVAPTYKLSIGSADNTDQVGIYHDNNTAYFRTTDGNFEFITDEGTNTSSFLMVKGKGTGLGYVRAYDAEDDAYIQLLSNFNLALLSGGGAAVSLDLQWEADIPVRVFAGSTEGETQEFKIYGRRTGDSLRVLEIGVGVDAADTASFDGVSNYTFDGNVGVGNTAPASKLDVTGVTTTDGLTQDGPTINNTSALTISSGLITVTKTRHTVATESAAYTDNLDSITAGTSGQIVTLSSASGQLITIRHNQGNILTADGSDLTLAWMGSTVTLEYNSSVSKWVQIYNAEVPSWLLYDRYDTALSAGNLDDTAAEPGPGTRDVVDTSSHITIAGGKLVFDGGTSAFDTTIVRYPVQPRFSGRVFLGKFATTSNQYAILGYGSEADSYAYGNGFRFGIAPLGSTDIYIRSAGSSTVVGTFATSTEYELAIVARASGAFWFIRGGAYTYWTLLAHTLTNSADLYPSVCSYNSAFTFDDCIIPSRLWLPNPLAYDTFTRADGAPGNSETVGPDGQSIEALAWVGAGAAISSNTLVITPTLGSELFANGDFSTDTDWTKGTGWTIGLGVASHAAGSASGLTQAVLTANTWFRLSYDVSSYTAGAITPVFHGPNGTTRTAAGSYVDTARATGANMTFWASSTAVLSLDNGSLKALTLSSLLTTQNYPSTNVMVIVTQPTYVTGTQSGAAARWDSTDSPTTGLFLYQDGANVKLDECVSGSYTNKLSVSSAYAADQRLALWLVGANWRAYKISSAGVMTLLGSGTTAVLSGTLHGVFSTTDGDSFDVWECWPSESETAFADLDTLSDTLLHKFPSGILVGSDDDNAVIDSGGIYRAYGSASTWRDELSPLIGQRLESPASALTVDYDEGALQYDQNTDLTDFVIMSPQLNHDRKLGAPVEVHLHWLQTTADTPNWLIYYRWQINGAAQTSSWTPLIPSGNVYTWSSGTLNQVTEFPAITPPDGDGPSDILQVKLMRDNDNDSTLFGGADPVAADVLAVSFDAHIECDTMGTDTEDAY